MKTFVITVLRADRPADHTTRNTRAEVDQHIRQIRHIDPSAVVIVEQIEVRG